MFDNYLVPSFLAREGQAPPPTSSEISIFKTQLLTQEAFFGSPETAIVQPRALFLKNKKHFLNRAVNPRRGCQLVSKTRTGWVLNRMKLFGGTLTKISDVFMLPSPYHPETDLRNRNGPGILINLGSVEAAKDAEILPPHQQA